MSKLESVAALIDAYLDGDEKEKAYENLNESDATIIMLRSTDDERVRTLKARLLKPGTKCREACSKHV